MTSSSQPAEVGRRFGFGANWRRYIETLDEGRIATAERSLASWLGSDGLRGTSFLDVGCGSGLFSLAARRMGSVVHSFDYDPDSVACTAFLRDRFSPDDGGWVVEQGSILDSDYVGRLGKFDVVYAWGVLHHTGAMWTALGNCIELVQPGGLLWVAVYRDEGKRSARWATVKHLYNRLPRSLRFLILGPSFVRLWGPTTIRDLRRGRPFETWRTYERKRGMHPWHDVVDWVGGYPFEVATLPDLRSFYGERDFAVEQVRSEGANHELLLRRLPSSASRGRSRG